MRKYYLVPMTVQDQLIPDDSSLEDELRWSLESGVMFGTPVQTDDGSYQIEIPHTLLKEKLDGTLHLEVSNDPDYPRVSILLKKGETEDELVRVESAPVGEEDTPQLRAAVYPKLFEDEPLIIPFQKEGN